MIVPTVIMGPRKRRDSLRKTRRAERVFDWMFHSTISVGCDVDSSGVFVQLLVAYGTILLKIERVSVKQH
eukprot:SAG11_NODE_262_length_11529_cov_12.277603_9_plen_70_part_00